MLFCQSDDVVGRYLCGQEREISGLGCCGILAEPARKIATDAAERQNFRAGIKMIERFFFDGINGKARRLTVSNRNDAAVLARSDPAEPRLRFCKGAVPRTKIALYHAYHPSKKALFGKKSRNRVMGLASDVGHVVECLPVVVANSRLERYCKQGRIILKMGRAWTFLSTNPISTATVQSEPQPEGCACGRDLPVSALIDQFHAVCSRTMKILSKHSMPYPLI